MRKCYLIGILDTTTKPPQLAEVCIASEEAGSLTVCLSKTRAFDLGVTTGYDYAEAQAQMLELLQDESFYAGQEWLRPFVAPILAAEGLSQ